VEETVNYIKNLEHTLETLQKRKLDHLRNAFLANQKPPSAASSSVISPDHPVSREAFLADQVGKVLSPLDMPVPLPPPGQQCCSIQTWTSPNVVLSIVGIDAYISVCTPKRSGLITAAAFFLERHGAEALAVQVYSDPLRTMFIMFARVRWYLCMHVHLSYFLDVSNYYVYFHFSDEIQVNEASSSINETQMPADERFKLALGELILWLGSSN
jgi:hypothetical protein